MTAPARDRKGGFALVEAIAVLALAALVLLALLVATDIVSRNSAVAARRAGDLETLATALAAVRRDLEGALHVPSALEPDAPIIFTGDSDSVGLVVEDDRSGRGMGESLLSIETRYGSRAGALIRSSAPFLPGMNGFAGADFGASTVLAEGPWRYRFSYAGDVNGELKWRSTWSRQRRLPAAIRLEVLNVRGRRVVPSLTVEVNVNAAGGCSEGDPRCRDQGTAPDKPGGPDAPTVEQ